MWGSSLGSREALAGYLSSTYYVVCTFHHIISYSPDAQAQRVAFSENLYLILATLAINVRSHYGG